MSQDLIAGWRPKKLALRKVKGSAISNYLFGGVLQRQGAAGQLQDIKTVFGSSRSGGNRINDLLAVGAGNYIAGSR